MRFKVPHLQRMMTHLGFAVIPRVLEQESLAEILSFYKDTDKKDLPFYTSNWVEDKDYKEKIHQFLKPILDKALQPHVTEFKSIYSYFLIKNPSNVTKVAIHQDWTLVDESEYTGISMWIPLVDTNKENGWFCVMPFSHLIFNNIRGTNIDMPYSDCGDQLEQQIMHPIPLKAGDAVFFDHRLVHFSPPNCTNTSRVAVGHVLIPQNAQVRHYFKYDMNSKDVYVQDAGDDILLKFSFKQTMESIFDRAQKIDKEAFRKFTINEIVYRYNRYKWMNRFFRPFLRFPYQV